jgi:hypothetical protein
VATESRFFLDPSQALGLLNGGSNPADFWQAFQLLATRFFATGFLAGLSLSVAGEVELVDSRGE